MSSFGPPRSGVSANGAKSTTKSRPGLSKKRQDHHGIHATDDLAVPVVGSGGEKPRPINTSSSSSTTSREKPSQRLNPKTVNPFTDAKKPKSAFASVYTNGGIPCRLCHGSVKHKLQWNSDPSMLPFDPLLVTLAEGLQEHKHPYQFVAQNGFRELLEVPDAQVKAMPVLPRLIAPIRTALASPHDTVFEGALNALVQLSSVVCEALIPHLKSLLALLAKKAMIKKWREKVLVTLNHVEHVCGIGSVPIIKSKIPTYCSSI